MEFFRKLSFHLFCFRMQILHATGLIRQLEKTYLMSSILSSAQNTPSPISMPHVQGVFLVLLSGIAGIAFCALLLEILCYNFKGTYTPPLPPPSIANTVQWIGYSQVQKQYLYRVYLYTSNGDALRPWCPVTRLLSWLRLDTRTKCHWNHVEKTRFSWPPFSYIRFKCDLDRSTILYRKNWNVWCYAPSFSFLMLHYTISKTYCPLCLLHTGFTPVNNILAITLEEVHLYCRKLTNMNILILWAKLTVYYEHFWLLALLKLLVPW